MAGVLGELVLDWGAESVLESGRGLCLSRVFNPQTGFFTGPSLVRFLRMLGLGEALGVLTGVLLTDCEFWGVRGVDG